MNALNIKWHDGTIAGWMLLCLLALVFIMGGSSRYDANSIMVFRPIATLFLILGLSQIKWESFKEVWPAIVVIGGMVFVSVIQLMPLPPSLWTNIPGREVYVDAAKLTGFDDVWRPISVVPSMTRNALFALLVPLSIVILFAVSPHVYRIRAIIAVGIFAGISSVLGIFQILAGKNSVLYFYKITNNDSAVGFFANANHNASLLATIPMVAAILIAKFNNIPSLFRMVIFVAIWIYAATIILVIGSRAGFALYLLASTILLLFVPLDAFHFWKKGKEKAMLAVKARYLIAFLLAGLLALIVAFGGNNRAISRILFSLDNTQVTEDRWLLIDPVRQMISDYFPFGGGVGTFPYSFYRYEPYELLMKTYWNHAHNDILEMLYEYGIFGLFIGIFGIFAGIRSVWLGWVNHGAMNRLTALCAALILFILLAGSAVDYPLRTPSLACIFALFFSILTANASKQKYENGQGK